ncbi:hypothetical protein [Sphingobium yanoikuyae]|uniref:hypothetical protein n=1 Tax=Sphingobium yanoikuyae TaxID=13690 RepID=UPI0035C7DDE8
MDDVKFGAAILQLFRVSQFPGEGLDMAVAFRAKAQALANGEIATIPIEKGEECRATSE